MKDVNIKTIEKKTNEINKTRESGREQCIKLNTNVKEGSVSNAVGLQ